MRSCYWFTVVMQSPPLFVVYLFLVLGWKGDEIGVRMGWEWTARIRWGPLDL